jgi:hypothetical protein
MSSAYFFFFSERPIGAQLCQREFVHKTVHAQGCVKQQSGLFCPITAFQIYDLVHD